MAGAEYAQTKREQNTIVLLNKAWFILIVLQISCLVSHILNGLHRTAAMTALYVLGLSLIHFFMRKGKINTAKIWAILVVNANTLAMAYLLGEHTHVIDFLLLTAIMPLYLFETNQQKLTAIGILLGVIPYAFYHYTIPFTRHWALPVLEQLEIYKTTVWVMVSSLCVLLYLMYHKNVIYEKETKEKEMLLHEQKKLYERILDQIPIDIVTFDKNLRYSYINMAAMKDSELRKEIIGKSNRDYAKEQHLDLSVANEREKLLRQAMQRGEKVEAEETLIDGKGEPKHTIKGACPVYADNTNELICLIGYSLDITQIKNAERKLREYANELERKNDDLQHFVHATSHDLKTPLRTIASYLQLIERKNKDVLDKDSQSLITATVDAVKYLNQLISDIFQYSIADKREMENTSCNAETVLEDILNKMKETISSRNASVKHGALPVLQISASHLGMLFSNLISNAIKYNTSAQPTVVIEATEKENELVITVTDNGIGIEGKYADQIFEIFKRLHTQTEYEGTGVGLAICKKIVTSYGGSIRVESSIGKGSVFYISFPKSIVIKNNIEKDNNSLPLALSA